MPKINHEKSLHNLSNGTEELLSLPQKKGVSLLKEVGGGSNNNYILTSDIDQVNSDLRKK